MSTTIHAYSAGIIDPETGTWDSSLDFHWFANEFAETAALVGYRAIGDSYGDDPDTALGLYRIELSDAERDALAAWYDAQYGTDDTMTPLDKAMDVIEWDRGWLHPAVTVVAQNDQNARHRDLIARTEVTA